MLLKIKDKPFINLDNFLDIEQHLKLKHVWEFLIAQKHRETKKGVWNAAGHNPDEIYNRKLIFREQDLLYYSMTRANKDRSDDSELDQHLRYFESTGDKEGQARYLKLRYGSFDPYNILHLRMTNKRLYAADAFTFSEDDWNSYSWETWMNDFPEIKSFAESLPFDYLGVVSAFYNEHYIPLGYHRDLNFFPYERGNNPNPFPHRQELIWFRFDLDRPFKLFDIDSSTGEVLETVPVEGYSAFFNHHNWHGNFDPYPNSTITLKFEGKFTDEFRKLVGIDDLNYYD